MKIYFLFVFEYLSLGKTLSDTYLAYCSPWQLASVTEGQGHCLLSMLIDVKLPTTHFWCCVYIQVVDFIVRNPILFGE